MRPHAHELIESVRHSLHDVVLPAVDDEWARYVGKCIDKLLVAVQVRMAHELAHLATDTHETAQLFEALRSRLTDLPGGEPALAELRAAVGAAAVTPALDPAQAEDLLARVGAANELARTQLARLVDLLYAAGRAELPSPARDAVSAAHESVREHLRRQLARDVELMSPTFMAFGDPARVAGARR